MDEYKLKMDVDDKIEMVKDERMLFYSKELANSYEQIQILEQLPKELLLELASFALGSWRDCCQCDEKVSISPISKNFTGREECPGCETEFDWYECGVCKKIYIDCYAGWNNGRPGDTLCDSCEGDKKYGGFCDYCGLSYCVDCVGKCLGNHSRDGKEAKQWCKHCERDLCELCGGGGPYCPRHFAKLCDVEYW